MSHVGPKGIPHRSSTGAKLVERLLSTQRIPRQPANQCPGEKCSMDWILIIMDFLQSLWLSYLYDIHIPIKMIQPQLWLRIQVTTRLRDRAGRAVTARVKMVHYDLHRLKGLWCRFVPGQTTSLSHLSILLSFIQHSKRFNTSETDQKQYAFVSLVVSRPTSPPSLGVESQFWKDKLIDQSDVKHQWKNVEKIDTICHNLSFGRLQSHFLWATDLWLPVATANDQQLDDAVEIDSRLRGMLQLRLEILQGKKHTYTYSYIHIHTCIYIYIFYISVIWNSIAHGVAIGQTSSSFPSASRTALGKSGPGKFCHAARFSCEKTPCIRTVMSFLECDNMQCSAMQCNAMPCNAMHV